jgi:hypothetical protein
VSLLSGHIDSLVGSSRLVRPCHHVPRPTGRSLPPTRYLPRSPRPTVSCLQLAPVSYSFRNRLEKRTTVSTSTTLRLPQAVSTPCIAICLMCSLPDASPHFRFIDLSLGMPTRDMCVRPIQLFQCLIKIEGAPCLPDSYYDAGFRSEKWTWLFDENMTA